MSALRPVCRFRPLTLGARPCQMSLLRCPMHKVPGLKRECGRVDLNGHPKPQPPPRLYAASGLQCH